MALVPTTNVDYVSDLCSHMAVDDPEEVGAVFDEDDVPEEAEELRWCLIGRFLTEKSIHFHSLKNTLAAFWKPVKGMFFRDLGQSYYLFQFFHEKDIQRVEKGGPWTFDRHLLLSRRLAPKEKPKAMPIHDYSIWLQVYDLPVGFQTEKVCTTIREFAGHYAESDIRNFDGSCKDFIRIRVILDVRVALKQQMRMKRRGGEWFYVKFQYERLPSFCFFCGIVGHSEQVCEKLYDNPAADGKPMPFGPNLRATGKKSVSIDGSRWIRQGGQRTTVQDDGGRDSMQVDAAEHKLGKFGFEGENSRTHNDDQIASQNMKVNAAEHGNLDHAAHADLVVNCSVIDGAFIVDAKRKRVDSINVVPKIG